MTIKRSLLIYSAIVLALGIFSGSALFYKGKDADAAEAEYEVRIGCASKGTCPDSDWSPDAPGSSGGTCAFHFTRTYKGDGNCKAGKTSGWIIGVDPDNIDASGYTECKSGPNPCGGGYDAYCICDKDVCPYDSTEIRVKRSLTDDWQRTMEIDCGDSFIIGSFHDGDYSNYADDTRIFFFPPGANTGSRLHNDDEYQTSTDGTYRMRVVTLKPDSNKWWSDSECQGTASVICIQDQDDESDFSITKVATNDNGPYNIGDTVNFRVQIVNTGETVIEAIDYRDAFDNRYLEFRNVLAVSPDHPGGFNMTPYFSLSTEETITTMSNSDITEQLGDLEPGELIYLDYTFTARSASNRACNDVFAQPEGLSEQHARDCVGIVISTDR